MLTGVLELLARDVSVYGTGLSGAQMRQFEQYLLLLTKWSARVNLVADVDPKVVQQRHFLESIALGTALREREMMRPGSEVLDVGAGAGFPGAVLKIVWPSIRLTLLEATAKKTAFLAALVGGLGLGDTRVLTGRAEDLAHEPDLRDGFDLVVSRAVAPLPALLELTLPFARIGGRAVCPKGSRAAAELGASRRALDLLGARAITIPFNVPGPPQSLVIAVKQRETPADYPRRSGIPRRSPL
jgi:16S rRNA (guanine527-N7)-methyltransferase